jgi:hypothetical protein
MPSVKVNGNYVDLGELGAPLDFYETKIGYVNEGTQSSHELSRPANPRLLHLATWFENQLDPDRTGTTTWSDSSDSVKKAVKQKFGIGSPPPSPTRPGPSSQAA